jgi:hypothetical protein
VRKRVGVVVDPAVLEGGVLASRRSATDVVCGVRRRASPFFFLFVFALVDCFWHGAIYPLFSRCAGWTFRGIGAARHGTAWYGVVWCGAVCE